jgi:hypothetical protein
MKITNRTADSRNANLDKIADSRGSSRVAFAIREDPRLFLLQVKNEGHCGDYGNGSAV